MSSKKNVMFTLTIFDSSFASLASWIASQVGGVTVGRELVGLPLGIFVGALVGIVDGSSDGLSEGADDG